VQVEAAAVVGQLLPSLDVPYLAPALVVVDLHLAGTLVLAAAIVVLLNIDVPPDAGVFRIVGFARPPTH
jgi:hypothetical protein